MGAPGVAFTPRFSKLLTHCGFPHPRRGPAARAGKTSHSISPKLKIHHHRHPTRSVAPTIMSENIQTQECPTTQMPLRSTSHRMHQPASPSIVKNRHWLSSKALGVSGPLRQPHSFHRRDSFQSFPHRATFRQGEWLMPQPTTSFPVLAQLPFPRRPARPKISLWTRTARSQPQTKRRQIPIATTVRIRSCMRLIINNLQFLNRDSTISEIPVAYD